MSSVLSVLRYVFFGCCCDERVIIIKKKPHQYLQHLNILDFSVNSSHKKNWGTLKVMGRSLLPSVGHETVFDTENN